MADKQATIKQVLEHLDARIAVHDKVADNYKTLLDAGNKTHSMKYRENIRQAVAVSRELYTLREFIKTGKLPSILREVPVKSEQAEEKSDSGEAAAVRA